jgi:hypothetical protein
MADDKPTLTRRRVLGSMATIGAAGAVGAGTWAQYSDEETLDITATAGSLDLRMEYEGTTYGEGDGSASVPISVGGGTDGESTNGSFAPGDSVERVVKLWNAGNTTGNSFDVSISNVDSGEGSSWEPEKNGGTVGELDDQLEIRVSLKNGGSFSNHRIIDSSGNFVAFNTARSNTYHEVENLDAGGSSADADELKVELHYVDDSNNNASMGDTLNFDLDVVLNQNA